MKKVWMGMDKRSLRIFTIKERYHNFKRIQSVARTTEFRSIVGIKEAIFILAVGNPAMLIRIDKKRWKKQLFIKKNTKSILR